MLQLDTVISNMIKTSSNHEQRVRRFMTTREEAVNRCLNSLIHTLSCRDGDSCKAHGCMKMKRVVEHTKTCPRKNNNFRGCSICTQLMNLCFYHSKICRAHVCHVPFCRIMKKKLQALNELYAQKQSIQSMKPVYQFPIPPIHPPVLKQSSSSSLSSINDGPDMIEPQPKRMRLDDSESSSSSFSDHSNIEAQNSNFNFNNVCNLLQEPQAAV
ncbi:hypothetical protein ACKWTF_006880 [Chironomus riparius]